MSDLLLRKPNRAPLGRWLLILGVSGSLAFVALRHGTYSLGDRQTLAVAIWAFIGLGAAIGVFPAVRPTRATAFAVCAMIVMAIWILLSLWWTESAERTYAEFARFVLFLGVSVLVWISIGRSNWRLVAAALVAAGVLVCGATVGSRLWPSLFPSDSLLQNLTNSRVIYPFGYWNAVGSWSAMTLTLCAAFAAHARSALVRALALASVPLCMAALYFSLSRAGFAGSAVGIAVLLALGPRRWGLALQVAAALAAGAFVIYALRAQQQLIDGTGSAGATAVVMAIALAAAGCAGVSWLFGRFDLSARLEMPPRIARPVFAAGAIVTVVLAIAVLPSAAQRGWDQFQQTDFAPTVSRDARLQRLNGNRHNVWDSALEGFTSSPLHGRGPGTYEFWWLREGAANEFLRDAHSLYLETLAELGIVGLLLLIGILGAIAAAALLARRALSDGGARGVHAGLIAVFAVWLVQAGVDWMWESTAVTVFALVAAWTAACASSERATARRGSPAALGLIVAGLLAVAIQLPGLASDRQIKLSQRDFAVRDYRGALDHANDAVAAQSWSATALAQRAQTEAALREYAAAGKDIERAIRREPTNWRWPLIATRIYVAAGEPEKAVAAFERARELNPRSQVFSGVER